MVKKLELTLNENAVDFLQEAIRHTRQSTPRDWKYAVLHLCSAIELLSKAILEKEHWSLIFEDINEASIIKIKTKKDFKSVSFEKALQRIQQIVKIKISSRDLSYLQSLMKLRNKGIHYSLVLNVEQAKSLVARGISLFLNLQQNIGSKTLSNRDFEIVVNRSLVQFQKYVDVRIRKLEKSLRTQARPHKYFRTCPFCAQKTLVLKDGNTICLFCGQECDFSELAEMSEGTGGPCPECGNGELGFILFNNEEGVFACVKCGFETPKSLNTKCTGCGHEFWNESASSLCKSCLDRAIDKF
jgi:hypothetical protein